MIEKIDEYFRLLYPQYENLSEEEQKRVLNDKKFIRENLDKIELMYQNACSNGKSPEEAIRGAVRLEKSNKYFEMLHSDSELETLSEEEYKKVLSDRTFIRENLDKIELMYQNACSNGKSPEEAIRDAVRLSRKISTQQIGQATINTPTATKKEAEQVENNENTRDDIKEGEKVGDDN